MMQFLFTQTPLAYFVSSFWRDEAFSYLMAKLPIHTLLWSTAQDANPPLYYLILKLWMTIFGTSEIALRSLSLLFFSATLYVVFLILNGIFKLSVKKSFFYLIFFLINPLLHYYAFEARMYSLSAFLATFLFYLYLKKEYSWYAYVALCSLLTHYFLFVVVALQIGVLFISGHKSDLHTLLRSLWRTTRWYLIWIGLVIVAQPPLGNSFWIQTASWKDVVFLPAVILTGYESNAWIKISFLPQLSFLIAGVVLYGCVKLFPHKNKNHVSLILWWGLGVPLIILLISFIKPVFLPRYLIFSAVGLTLLLIQSIEIIINKYIRYILLALLFFFLCLYSTLQVNMRKKAPLKNTFRVIQNKMSLKDVLYVTHEYDFHPAQYYLPNTPVFIYGKTYEELPWFVGKVLIDKAALKDVLPLYPERAFILNNNGSYSIMAR